jgi:hypothetical protein
MSELQIVSVALPCRQNVSSAASPHSLPIGTCTLLNDVTQCRALNTANRWPTKQHQQQVLCFVASQIKARDIVLPGELALLH